MVHLQHASHKKSSLGPGSPCKRNIFLSRTSGLNRSFPIPQRSHQCIRIDSSLDAWRERFMQQCLNNFKISREEMVNSRRNGLGVIHGDYLNDEEMLGRLWANYKAHNELNCRLHTDTPSADTADLLERGLQFEDQENENLYNPDLDESIAQEEFYFNAIIEAFQNQEFTSATC